MAIAPVNKFVNIAVPVAPGAQELYEVPTGTSSLLLYAQVANVAIGVTYPTVTFWQRRESRSTGNTRDIKVVQDAEIPPNDGLILVDGRIVLEKTPLVLDKVFIRGHQVGVTTVSGAAYDEPTGIVTVTTMGDHGFSPTEKITLGGLYFTCGANYTAGSNTTYSPTTGLLELDVGSGHKLQVGQFITIDDDGLTFTCTHGSGNHTYPRSTDPASNKALPILSISNSTVTVKVLDSLPSSNVTPHTFVTGAPNAIKNSYTGITTNVFPDPQQSYVVETVPSSTTFSLDVGSSTGNIHNYQPSPHRFVRATPLCVEVVDGTGSSHSAGDKFSVWNAEYNPTSGEIVLTIGANSLVNGNTIKIADNSLVFTCTMDGNFSEHSYPRSTDPVSGSSMALAVATFNESIRVQVGATNAGGMVAPLQMEFIASILENSNV
tara:strand:- start:5401 stop:6699 length:1299 start_codon:yes stop_codon:yes gene_type:complete